MPLVRRRDFLIGMGAMTALAAHTPGLFGGEKVEELVFGVRRLRRPGASGISFPAIAAASMPEILVIGDSGRGTPMRGRADLGESLAGGYVELRRYRFDREEDRVRAPEVFVRAGIRPLLTGETGEFLFEFETLASRERAWREIAGHPQWLASRAQLEDLAIYKVK